MPVSCSIEARFCRISAKLETMAVKLSTAMARDTCFSSLVTSRPLSAYIKDHVDICIVMSVHAPPVGAIDQMRERENGREKERKKINEPTINKTSPSHKTGSKCTRQR